MSSIERKPAASGAPSSADSKTPDVNQKNGRVILHSRKQVGGDSNTADLRCEISLVFMYGGSLHVITTGASCLDSDRIYNN
jgi:hypothetical protein